MFYLKKIFSFFKRRNGNKKIYRLPLSTLMESRDRARILEDPDVALEEKLKIEEEMISKVMDRFVDAFDEVMIKHAQLVGKAMEKNTEAINLKIEEEVKKVNDRINELEEKLKREYVEREVEREKMLFSALKEKGFIIPEEVVENLQLGSDNGGDNSLELREEMSHEDLEHEDLEEDSEFLEVLEGNVDVDESSAQKLEESGVNISDEDKPFEVDWNYWLGYNLLHLFIVDKFFEDRFDSVDPVLPNRDSVDYRNLYNLFKFSLKKRYKDIEVKFDSNLLESWYDYNCSVFGKVYKLFVNDFFISLKEIPISQLDGRDLLADILLFDFLNFLMGKMIYDFGSVSYFSAEERSKVGLSSLIKERYRYYSKTFLSSHNASVLYFLLLFFSSFDRKKFSSKDFILLLISVLVHDAGKIYASRISSHKSEEVWEILLKEYFSRFSGDGLKSVFIRFLSLAEKNDLSPEKLFEEVDSLENFFRTREEVLFLEFVFRNHDSLADEGVFSRKYLDLFDVVFFADKYARLLENRLMDYFKLRYKEENFSLSFDELKSFVSNDRLFNLLPQGYKWSFYSLNAGSKVNHSEHFSIVRNISEKGKNVFVSDITDIFKFFFSIKGSNIMEHSSYRIDYVKTRDIYKIPIRSFLVEFLSKGWGDLSLMFFKDVSMRGKDSDDFFDIKDLYYVYKRIGSGGDFSKNIFLERFKDQLYLCVSPGAVNILNKK